MRESQVPEGSRSVAESADTSGPERGSFGTVLSARAVHSLVILAIAGVVLYAAATLASDYRAVLSALMRFPLKTLLLVLVLVVIGWLLRGWRFYYYLRQTGREVPLGYSESVFLASFALTGTPGKMGEAVKGVFLKEDYGISITAVVGILVVERLMDLWGVLLLGSLSFLLFSDWIGAFLVCAVVVIGGGIFLCMERAYRPVLERIARIRFLSWIAERILGVLLTGRELMTPRIFLVGLIVSAVAWGMESFSLYLILDGLHLPSTLLEANFVYCFSTIIGALSMLPGGVGGTEAGMIALLAVLGISYSSGLPAVILIRVCTLWLAILVGIAFTMIMLGRSRRRVERLHGGAH
ncbi:MAG: lysylphosphatidylglycerol synthase transmembrane domain-containing protein [Deltaproteobacteria bacterium]